MILEVRNQLYRTRLNLRLISWRSLTFPVGERYFISSVRMFRDQITDPELQARVTDFIQQEAQHGLVHDEMNEVMRRQALLRLV